MLARLKKFHFIFLLFMSGWPFVVQASEIVPKVEEADRKNLQFPLSEKELRDLVVELAPKVNLFRDIWALDSAAEFYGGTTRDFLYWILSHFKGLKSSDEIEAAKTKLRHLTVIDIRSILSYESDIDVMSRDRHKILSLSAETYGIRKIDTINFDRTDSTTVMGKSEVDQGSIPAEKIRLGQTGIQKKMPGLGDGLYEILSGHLSISIPDPLLYRETYYAKRGLNHPVLLAVRYIRILAQDFMHRFGKNRTDIESQEALLDKASIAWVKQVVDSAMSDSKFDDFIRNDQGRKWLSASIKKAFRGYSNSTAAFRWFQYFGVEKLQRFYSKEIPSLHDYLLIKNWDESAIRQHWRELPEKYSENGVLIAPKDIFSDGYFYHGAGSAEAFRSMIFQGAIPSQSGSAGGGLYGVPVQYFNTAETFAGRSGNSDLIVRAPVLDSARIVDISEGLGKKLFQEWEAWQLRSESHEVSEDAFAEYYGFDIVLYAYSPLAAVVKNKRSLGPFAGLRIQLLSLHEIYRHASVARSDLEILQILKLIYFNQLNELEFNRVAGIMPQDSLLRGLLSEDFWIWLMRKEDTTSKIKDFIKYTIKLGGSMDQLVEISLRAYLQQLKLEFSSYEKVEYIHRLHYFFLDIQSIEKNIFSDQRVIRSFERILSEFSTENTEDFQKVYRFIPPEIIFGIYSENQNRFPNWLFDLPLGVHHYFEAFTKNFRARVSLAQEKFLVDYFFSEAHLGKTLPQLGLWFLLQDYEASLFSSNFWNQISQRIKSLNKHHLKELPSKEILGVLILRLKGLLKDPLSGDRFSKLESLLLLVHFSISDPNYYGKLENLRPISGLTTFINELVRLSEDAAGGEDLNNVHLDDESLDKLERWLSDPAFHSKWVGHQRHWNPDKDIRLLTLKLMQRLLSLQDLHQLWLRLSDIPFYQRYFAQFIMPKYAWLSSYMGEVFNLAEAHKADREIAKYIVKGELQEGIFGGPLESDTKEQLRVILQNRPDSDFEFGPKDPPEVLEEIRSFRSSLGAEVPIVSSHHERPHLNENSSIEDSSSFLKNIFFRGFKLTPEEWLQLKNIWTHYFESSPLPVLEKHQVIGASINESVAGAANFSEAWNIVNSEIFEVNFLGLKPWGVMAGKPLPARKVTDAKRVRKVTAGDLGIRMVTVVEPAQLIHTKNPYRKQAAVLLNSAAPWMVIGDGLYTRNALSVADRDLKLGMMHSPYFLRVDPEAVDGVDFDRVDALGETTHYIWRTTWALGPVIDARDELIEEIMNWSKNRKNSHFVYYFISRQIGGSGKLIRSSEKLEILKNLLKHGNVDREIASELADHLLGDRGREKSETEKSELVALERAIPEILEHLVKAGHADYELDQTFYIDSDTWKSLKPLVESLRGKEISLKNMRDLFASGFSFIMPERREENCPKNLEGLAP